MARKKTKEEKEYDVLLANVREVSKHRFGKEFIWHILSMCDIYSDGFTGNETTFYNEGKRSVGLQILQLLEESDPSFYPRLLLEKQKYKGDENGTSIDSDTGTDYSSDD